RKTRRPAKPASSPPPLGARRHSAAENQTRARSERTVHCLGEGLPRRFAGTRSAARRLARPPSAYKAELNAGARPASRLEPPPSRILCSHCPRLTSGAMPWAACRCLNESNPKHEIRNPKQIPNPKLQRSKPGRQFGLGFEVLCFGFVSDLMLRI